MYCATPLLVKVCSSQTPAAGAVMASCGGYKLITTLQFSTNTTCTPSEIVLVNASEFGRATESPFRLSLAEGGVIAGAVLTIWATAWVFKAVTKSLSSGDPER